MKTPLAAKAAIAIINSVANPALNLDTKNCNARTLSEIIARETAADELLQALLDELNVLDAEARSWAGFPATDPAYIALEKRRSKIRAAIAKAGAP
jgi:hypothetical protein